jgi:hypothetical protein
LAEAIYSEDDGEAVVEVTLDGNVFPSLVILEEEFLEMVDSYVASKARLLIERRVYDDSELGWFLADPSCAECSGPGGIRIYTPERPMPIEIEAIGPDGPFSFIRLRTPSPQADGDGR